MAWCKYEGPPLAATMILAAALTLAWLRPPGWLRRLGHLSVPLAGLAAGYLPWRLFALQQHLEIGADHIQSFYPHQMVQAIYYLLAGPWSALLFRLPLAGPGSWPSSSPAGACGAPPCSSWPSLSAATSLAIILAYAVAPTAAAEFPAYVRATLDRLLLHLTPVAALLLALGLKTLRDENLEGRAGGSLTKESPALPLRKTLPTPGKGGG